MRIIIEVDHETKAATIERREASAVIPGSEMEAAGAAPDFSAPGTAEGGYIETTSEDDLGDEAGQAGPAEFVGAGPADLPGLMGIDELAPEDEGETEQAEAMASSSLEDMPEDSEDAGGAPGNGGVEGATQAETYIEVVQEEPLLEEDAGMPADGPDDTEAADET